jgi:hypothetical protein
VEVSNNLDRGVSLAVVKDHYDANQLTINFTNKSEDKTKERIQASAPMTVNICVT